MIKKLLKNKVFKGVIIAVLCLCLLGGVAVVGINAYMISYVSDYILTEEEYLNNIDKINVAVRNSNEHGRFSVVDYMSSQIILSSLDTKFFVERIFNTPYKETKKELRNELLDLLLELNKEQQEKVVKFIKDYIL